MIQEILGPSILRPSMKPSATNPQKPKGWNILLTVCGEGPKLTFSNPSAETVADILWITADILKVKAMASLTDSKPQVVAHFMQEDVAETKMRQIKSVPPFIKNAHYCFQLTKD